MKSHLLKCDARVFEEVWNERKLFEFRKNDREFEAGDTLTLEEVGSSGALTGRRIFADVTYTLRGPDYGVPVGYVVMSLSPDTLKVADSGRMK